MTRGFTSMDWLIRKRSYAFISYRLFV